jgi:hypothetical protein
MPSFIPTYDATKVLTGVVALFIGPYSATAPLALPARTVPLGGAWPLGWVPIGATEDGVTENFQRSTQKIMIEEQATPVIEETESIDWNFEATLSQDTLDTMKLAFGGGTITVVPPASGVPGYRTLQISTTMDKLCLGMEGKNSYGKPTRYNVPLINSTGNVSKKNRRAADARRYATKFSVLCAPEQVVVEEIYADALP